MKKGKLIFLLAAILSLTVFLVACGDKENDLPDDSSADTSQGAEDQGEQEIKHEIRDYFILDNGIEATSYAEISKLEGTVCDADDDHNLVALRTKDLNNKNEVVETVTVYDVMTGEKLLEHSVANLLDETRYYEITYLDVEVDYPIIRVSERSYSEDSENAVYEYSYYLAKKGSSVLKETTLHTYDIASYGNNLYQVTLGDEMFWIDSDMEVVRTANAIVSAGYATRFNYEYKGYLYSWSNSELHVFNRLGEICGRYAATHEGEINVHVLNDGNVLIQDVEYLDDEFALYDFLLGSHHCVMNSYIMNMVDGTLTKVELDFIVDELESAYAYDEDTSTFPMQLAEGHENQAIVYRYANGAVARTPLYVVLDNKLQIEYTLKNDTLGVDLYSIDVINSNYYTARVYEGNVSQRWLFDLDGKKITIIAEDADVTDKYIVTDNAIYDHKMNVVYDIKGGDFSGTLYGVDENSNKIYFVKHNFVTGGEEAYVYDEKEKAPVLIVDGVENYFVGVEDGSYITYEMDTGELTIYNAESKALVAFHGAPRMNTLEDALIVSVAFEGKDIIFVVK